MRDVTERVMERMGATAREDAERAIDATLEALGERLAAVEVAALADTLPPALAGPLVRRRAVAASRDAMRFYARVADLGGMPLLRATEAAQAVCEAVAEAVDAEALSRLQHAPPELAALFTPRLREGERVQPRASEAGHGSTLATARPGSTRPLSEAAPPDAPRDRDV